MKDIFKFKRLHILVILFIFSANLWSQDKIIPQISASNKNLIYQEGEDAIVTNFATSATLNYSASEQRTLQLNTYTGNYQSGAYFAEYSIYVEEDGVYSFWYSGTPPGTKEDIYPSYSSPFTLIIDDNIIKKYREDVNVVESYAPGLYWIKTETLNLTAGYHNIRFEVEEKRGFDGKYYFYLDSFFLFKGDENAPGLVPDIFPVDMLDRSIDNSFKSINYYQNIIKNDPSKIGSYVSLAHIYILIGDYLNAIKMLTRAIQIDPLEKTAKLLLAKTRIWNGNTDKGIQLYESYLTQYPESLAVWEEAGKIAAWVGKYNKSISLYKQGLAIYPESISLNINLALTYLWNAMIQDGLELLEQQESRTLGDLDSIKNLASVYNINGYPDYAVEVYEKSIKENPEFIELYLNLEKQYRDLGKSNEAEDVLSRIDENFFISEQLKNIMKSNTKKLNIKNLFISDLENKIELDPMNLELRQLLVQTLFWNGLVEEAIHEYKAIITVNHYYETVDFELDSIDLYYGYDVIKHMAAYFNDNITKMSTFKKQFYNDVISYRTAIINNLLIEEKATKLSDIVTSINLLLDQNEYYYNQFNILKDFINETNLKENELEKLFQSILSGNTWALEEDDLVEELKEIAEDSANSSFSNYILSSFYLISGDYEKSDEIINDLDQYSSKSKLLRYHNSLWKDEEIDKELLADLSIYYEQLKKEEQIINGVNQVIAETVVISPEYIEDIFPLIDRIEQEQQRVSNFKKVLLSYEVDQKKLIYNKMLRSIFKHQENTHLLRYTIGDYYLQSELYKDALKQFNQVIAIDPFNISAKFKLGRLEQLTGDWKNALTSYEEVFTVDPAYQNASTMYNQLSRLHPETSAGVFEYYIDTSKIEYSSEFKTDMDITSWLTISPSWNGLSTTYLEWDDLGAPRKYKLDDFIINGDITVDGGDFTLKPAIGVTAYNSMFDEISYLTDISYEDILASAELTPNLSLLISKNIKNYTVSADFSTSLLDESSPDDIADITTTTQGYTISGYFPLIGNKYLSSLSFRSFAQLDDRTGTDHDNRIYTFAQDLFSTFILLKDPWTTQIIYSATSFENSVNADTDIYYTPENVLISKIGGTTSSYIGLYGGVLSLSGRLAAGVYVEQLLDDRTTSFTADSDLQISFDKDDKSLYFKIYGSGSFSDTESIDYWSLQASLGFNISLYKLLAP